jgi:ELWxxDGT repeat protein
MQIKKRFHPPNLVLQLGCLCVLAGALLLPLAQGAHGGAAGPAVLVKDINPGLGDAISMASSRPLAGAHGQLFFAADNGTDGEALWKSDGSPGGTSLVADIAPELTFAQISWLTNVNETVFFSANDGVHGNELWKSDGSAAGTTLVADIHPGSATSFPEWLTNVNGTLFFHALDAVGWGLWKSDGSAAGTVLLKRHAAPVTNLVNVNGLLYYTSNEGAGGLVNGLWRSDGTAAGTILLKTFAAVPQPNPMAPPQPSLRSLTAVGQQLFFVAYTSGRGYELWKSDGTAAGTLRVSATGPQTAAGDIWFLQEVNGAVFALVDQSQQNIALWRSDGTAAGTRRIKDFDPGTSASYYTSLPTIASVDGKLVFALYPATQLPGLRNGAIWSSDGTSAGTIPINEQLAQTLPPVVVCGTLYFSARATAGAEQGDELWQSDGTASGTILVQDIAPGPADSSPMHLTAVAHQLFFSADDATNGRELWALPIAHTATIGPTPAAFLPHQVLLPHMQVDASC